MSLKGYSFVPDQGYIAFPKDLEVSSWGSVVAVAIPETGIADAEVMLGSRVDGVLKGLVLFGVSALGAAVNRMPSAASVADNGFDRQERILDADLARALLDDDPARVAAAEVLRDALLLGDGTDQTQLAFQDEVNFGRSQVDLAKQPNISSALALLGLTDRIARISEATERLAIAIGRSDQDASLSAAKRLKLARVQCAAIFNVIHQTLDQLKTASATPTARDRFSALLAPFEALLARHPRPSPAPDPTPPTT